MTADVRPEMLAFLQQALEVADDGVFRIDGPLELSSFMPLADLNGFDALRNEAWPPQKSVDIEPGEKLFEIIARRDVLLYHPYQTFEPVVRLVQEAAVDPDVLAIKQILYRTSRNSPIVTALAEAARRGALEVIGWEGGLIGRGLGILRQVTILGDGAVWIWNLAGEHFGERIEIVDYFHASEHLWTVARLALAERAEQEAWVSARKGELYEQGTGPVLVALQAVRALAPDGAAALQTERGYFRKNAARMDYPRFLALGLEFQLAADLLRTAVSPTFQEIGKLACVAAIRTALNFFLQREMDHAHRAGR